jgi:Fic family protein
MKVLSQGDNIMQPLGYKWITVHFNLDVLPHHCASFLSDKSVHRKVERSDGSTEEYYPKGKACEDTVCGHLEFAVKNEGINLAILKACFPQVDAAELTAHILSKQTGQYVRKLWFLYETLTGKLLDIPDLTQGNYVDLLDSENYFTAAPIAQQRQRIKMNLPGTIDFSPQLRRTDKIKAFEAKALNAQCSRILADYDEQLAARAVNQLYLGETKSSFQIEKEALSTDRTARFKQLLTHVGSEQYLSAQGLQKLHRQIITDSRFQTEGYRTTQEYVGSSTFHGEEIHFIPPRPEELDRLMNSFLICGERILSSNIHPVAAAAALSFAFIYLHPFKDGNGRMHRFLIHHILAKKEFTPPGLIFPVSAVMLRDLKKYQSVLNVFSVPLLEHIRFRQDADGRMTVTNETADYYRYMDLTATVELLFELIEQTLDKDLIQELNFLKNYDQAVRELTHMMDGLSGKEIDLFVNVCRENGMRLSANKRQKFFPELTDEEVVRMQDAVRRAFEAG